jgi:L-fuculose-phosphate aldolase
MDEIERMRARIVRFGRMLFERKLTDAAGGNISARVGDHICITPRYAGQKRQWQLEPANVLVYDMAGNFITGDGEVSREAKVHFRLYHEYPDGMAVVHCHPRHVLTFCSTGEPIPPVLEATWKFGEIPVAPYAPAHSQELSDYISAGLRGQEARIRLHAAAVIARWHGLFVLGKTLDAAFDAAERIDVNAAIILASGGLAAARQRAAELGADLARWEEK